MITPGSGAATEALVRHAARIETLEKLAKTTVDWTGGLNPYADITVGGKAKTPFGPIPGVTQESLSRHGKIMGALPKARALAAEQSMWNWLTNLPKKALRGTVGAGSALTPFPYLSRGYKSLGQARQAVQAKSRQPVMSGLGGQAARTR